jgi:hypothetical protein
MLFLSGSSTWQSDFGDPQGTGFIVFSARIGDHDSQVWENYGASNKDPFRPPWDDNRGQYTRRSNTHRDQISLGPACLFVA